jgi:hypothetical protein
MDPIQSEFDFERLSWHDCSLWRIELGVGSPNDGDWTAELTFGLDYIVEWICGTASQAFRIAPATLTFHNVTDPKIDIDWGRSGFQVAIHPLWIDRIVREPVRDQKVCLDRPYYSWQILLNWPARSAITFGASGFTQTFLGEPLLCQRQHLTPRERAQLIRPT